MSGSQSDLAHVRFISAGAGSGKTYHLTEGLEQALSDGRAMPAAVIGTTFTVKAATELHDRVRTRLIRSGRPLLSEQMALAVIGTVHSVCGRLLRRFAFELGLSPELNVASVEDGARLFNQALDEVLSADRVREMNLRAERLGLVDDKDGTSWQDHVRKIAEETRSNDIDPTTLPTMGRESAIRFLSYFPEATCDDEAREALLAAVQEAIANIDLASDSTKTTRNYVSQLRSAAAELRRDNCRWTLWISLSKSLAAKRSEFAAMSVRAAAASYDGHSGFHADIRRYIEGVFAIAGEALSRFQSLKTERGLIDYDDMEQLALRALDEPAVAERLSDEVDLLLVDEFQDTNPMQLALFMKIARLAREVVFVGDVKQAIFGFRGSDPELVRGTLDTLAACGSRLDVLDSSWRARPSIVRYLNAVFGEAFERDGMKRALVELSPERPGDSRLASGGALDPPKDEESSGAGRRFGTRYSGIQEIRTTSERPGDERNAGCHLRRYCGARHDQRSRASHRESVARTTHTHEDDPGRASRDARGVPCKSVPVPPERSRRHHRHGRNPGSGLL